MRSWFQGLKGRLLLAALLPLFGFVILFFVAESGLGKAGEMLKRAHTELIPNFEALGEMRQSRNKFLYQAYAALVDWNDLKKKESHIQSAVESIEEFKTSYKSYKEAPFQPGEEAIHNRVKDQMPEFFSSMDQIVARLKGTQPEDFEKAKANLGGRFSELSASVRTFNRDVNQLYVEISHEEMKSSEATQRQMFVMLLLLTVVITAVVFAILLWIASKVSGAVGGISGNLSNASQQVLVSVEQLNQAGQNLASSSAQAASSLEETVASLEEITSMVKINSENAKQAANLSQISRDNALKGEGEIKNLITVMKQVSESSRKIEEIINVIDDIAFQTNLLALNAAVESARAGEQGKGFAVVAEAVRGLAQKSGEAAKDISGLIQKSVGEINQGTEVADRSGEVLSAIVESVKKVSDLNEEIARASEDQADGVGQIGKAMNQLDQAVQSNAASAEEIAATAEEINTLAMNTQRYSEELKQTVLGRSDESPA